jgi:hypothetical protein
MRRAVTRAGLVAALCGAFAGCGDEDAVDQIQIVDRAQDASNDDAHTDGVGPAGCQENGVTFRMAAWRPEGGEPNDLCHCAGGWLTIKSAGGEPVDRWGYCKRDCNDCSSRLCPPIIACIPSDLPHDGATQSWTGAYFVAGACTNGMECAQQTCAPTGSKWIATMCALPGTKSDASSLCMRNGDDPVCVDVPFEYPSLDPVEGIIRPLSD